MTPSQGSFAGHGGIAIHWRRAAPHGPPRAVVLVSHGYAEHVGRYDHVVAHLVARGFAVAGVDHRGHGRSAGPRGHCRDLDEMVADLRTLASHAEQWWPGTPRVLLGHSMGGLIGLRYLLAYPETVRAGVLSAPALRVPDAAPRALLALVRGLGRVVPRLPLRSRLDQSALARDPAVGAAYVADPLVHRRATAGFVRAMYRAQRDTMARAASLRPPTLVLQGAADRIVLAAGASELASRLGAPHEAVMLPGFYHELLNEPPAERAKVLAAIDAWLDRWLAG
ncbi:MAG: lysophospholipase [bacterium]|nr:lysophospholipase [bacterium]